MSFTNQDDAFLVPTIPLKYEGAPTDDHQLVNKLYVDGVGGGGGSNGLNGMNVIETWTNSGDYNASGNMNIDTHNYVYNFSSYPATITVNENDIYGNNVEIWMNTLRALITQSSLNTKIVVSDSGGNYIIAEVTGVSGNNEGTYDLSISITGQSSAFNTDTSVVTDTSMSICMFFTGPQGPQGPQGEPGMSG